MEKVLIIGSGSTFHNQRAFFAPVTTGSQHMNAAFEDWLMDTCAAPDLSDADRVQRLMDWESALHARYCHPREEHLLPLQVAWGNPLQSSCFGFVF